MAEFNKAPSTGFSAGGALVSGLAYSAAQYVCTSGPQDVSQVRAEMDIEGLPPYLQATNSRRLQHKTTDGSTYVMTTDGATATSSNIPLASIRSAQIIDGMLIAKNHTDNTSASWKVTFAVKQNASAGTTVIDGLAITAIGANTGFTDPTVTADTTTGGWNLNVTGIAGKSIWWSFGYMATTSN